MTLQAAFGAMRAGAARATVGERVTYRLYVDSTKSPALGLVHEVFHDVEVDGVTRSDVTADQATASGGFLQVGDVTFTLPTEALASELPRAKARGLSTQDRIVSRGGSFRVLGVNERGAGSYVAHGRGQ